MNLAGDILEVLQVVFQDKTPQGEEVTMVLVLNIDCTPGIRTASEPFPFLILNYDIGPNNCKWYKFVFWACFFIRKLIHRDVILGKLGQDLDKKEEEKYSELCDD